MIVSMMRVMLLQLWRDRGALVLAFVLPPIIFAIFAAIFSNATNGDLDLDVALAVATDNQRTLEIADAFASSGQFNIFSEEDWTLDDVREQVRLGFADTGIVFAGDLTGLNTARIEVVVEPSREIAATVAAGQVQQFIAVNAPDIVLRQNAVTISELVGGLTAQQAGQLDVAIEGIAANRVEGTVSSSSEGGEMMVRVAAMEETDQQLADPTIAYYAGATAILFLLFSTMQGAAVSLEERRSGITERLLLGPGGVFRMTAGKFVYLTLQGVVQASVILIVAAVMFSLPVMQNLLLLNIASVCMAACAAGLALAVTSFCQSPSQAHTVSTFLVLIFSSIGGSMVPRFMMPDWLQSVGLLTPNAWAIEAYYGILARGDGLLEIAHAAFILLALGVAGLFVASFVSHRKIGS